jgi:hypothetical protein
MSLPLRVVCPRCLYASATLVCSACGVWIGNKR